MKRAIAVLMVVCVLAASSYGVIQAYNFEGSDISGFGGGTVIEGIGATTPTHSLKVSGGGWGNTWEMYLNGTPAKDALANVGTVLVDVTTVASDFPQGWASMGLLINAGGESGNIWNVFDWQGLTLGTTQTLTFQLPAEVMANIPSYNWWPAPRKLIQVG